MQRRTYLAACTGVVGTLAGCSGILGGSDGGSGDDRGPAETVEAFYEASQAGNGDEARSYIHSDAELPPLTDEALAQLQESSLELEATEVIEENEESAVVEATVSQEHRMTGERVENTVQFELRREDGAWRLYAQPLPGPDGPVAPTVVWETSSRTDGDGAVTAVEFVHGGGDTVDATTLSARAGGTTAGPVGESTDVVTGTGVIVPLDGSGDPLGAATDVELVWTDPDGEESQVLSHHTIGAETAGSLGDRIRLDG